MTSRSTESPLVLRLVGGDPDAEREVLADLATSRSVGVLVAGAVLTGDDDPLTRAAGVAVTARDRQLVALTAAHVAGRADLFDALVRDHLATYPDHLLAAWIAARTPRSTS